MRLASSSDSAFREGFRRLNQLIRDGGTLSGFEKNCVFLNVHGERFATISAVSGLDFPDDSRSHALVDWDHDGDVDLWTANRTAPMLRFLRNDTPQGNHFVVLRLEGVECNRDAIGARVEVVLANGQQKRLLKTLRAGEGFLGQSSKWLHFGLGEGGHIKQITVWWPRANQREVFHGVQPDGRYHLVQGTGTARIEPPRIPSVEFTAKTSSERASTEQSEVLLSSRLPLPNLDYISFDQPTARVQYTSGRPLLINIWAHWCLPCVGELKELTSNAGRLKAAGLDVLALAASSQPDDFSNATTQARKLIAGIRFPFSSGMATESTLDRLQTLYDTPFGSHRPLPVPTSFLVTAAGRLAGIYRGPVNIDRLLADVNRLKLSGSELHRAALPFAGKWYSVPRAPAPIVIALDLLDKGHVADTLDYVRHNRGSLESHKEYTKLLSWLGEKLFAAGDTITAIAQFEEALRLEPNNLTAINNLAWQMATHAKLTPSDRKRAVMWAEKGAQLTKFQNLTLLDTLAAAHASAGQYDRATAAIGRAIDVAKATGQRQRLPGLERLRDRYKKGLAHP